MGQPLFRTDPLSNPMFDRIRHVPTMKRLNRGCALIQTWFRETLFLYLLLHLLHNKPTITHYLSSLTFNNLHICSSSGWLHYYLLHI
ncbi:hypothetical protein QVD17_38867 [Tagetes erecta]|uniref:Uncharacterized protein n=1 Tax=Tagetes erecta TaxID=13708 RepID=A0AAD8NGK9_TARER|nr:hypothetical protein QVD17_38867 [Tagetes erecta]